MNTATMIFDSSIATVPSESGNRGKAASERAGDSEQQRFADVLPLAEAALKAPSEKNAADKTPKADQSVDEKANESSRVHTDRPKRQQDETVTRNSQVIGWPFAEFVQPVTSRQSKGVAGVSQQARSMVAGQAVKPSADGPGVVRQALKLASSPGQASAAGWKSVQARPSQQPSANKHPEGAPDKVTIMANAAASGKQENPSPAGANRQTTASPQPSQKTAAAGAVQTTQPLPAGVQAGQADARSERPRKSPDAQVVKAAPQPDESKPPSTVKSVAGGQPDVTEKTGQASARPQAVNPQTATSTEVSPRSEKNLPGLPRDEHENVTRKQSPPAPGERMKAEPAPSTVRDIPAAGPKEGGAVTPNPSASPAGESVASALRSGVQTQVRPQASTDSAATRAAVPSIGEQILDSIQASATRGDRQVSIRLNPPELGTVLVRFQERGELLNGTLEIGSREARREIERALPQVVRSLQEAGVQIRRIDIVASDQPERDSGREHLTQDAWPQHQGSGQGREHSQASPQMRWSQGTGSHSAVPQTVSGDESRTAVAQGRIDLLL